MATYIHTETLINMFPNTYRLMQAIAMKELASAQSMMIVDIKSMLNDMNFQSDVNTELKLLKPLHQDSFDEDFAYFMMTVGSQTIFIDYYPINTNNNVSAFYEFEVFAS